MKTTDEIGKEVIRVLYDSGMVKIFPRDNKDGWKLHNGRWSPFYIQIRPLFSIPNSKKLVDLIGDAMVTLIHANLPKITKLVGVASAGIPISVILSYKSEIPLCYTRRVCNINTETEVNEQYKELLRETNDEYGEHALLEGKFIDGDDLLLVDDLITDGKSKLIAKRLVEVETERQLKSVQCNNVIVIVDREQGGKEVLRSHGIQLYSLIPFKSKGIFWLKDKLSQQEFDLLQDYYRNTKKYQNPKYREKIAMKFE